MCSPLITSGAGALHRFFLIYKAMILFLKLLTILLQHIYLLLITSFGNRPIINQENKLKYLEVQNEEYEY